MKLFLTLAIAVGLTIAIPAPTNMLVRTSNLILTGTKTTPGEVNRYRHYINNFLVSPQPKGTNYMDTGVKLSVSIPFHDNRKLHYSDGIPIAV